jgi:hypothetical protein
MLVVEWVLVLQQSIVLFSGQSIIGIVDVVEDGFIGELDICNLRAVM